jgi:hypothetical protein
LILLIIITPVLVEYDDTVPSKRLFGSDCDTTTTELPVIYAKLGSTVTVTDPSSTGVIVTLVVVAVAKRSAKPVGPVDPVGPVHPVGPSIPSRFTL